MSDYSELKRLAELAIDEGVESGQRWPQEDDRFEPDLISAEMDYVKAASPIAVLALIAENESLRKDADKWKIVEHAMESLKSDERNASIWTVCSRLLISTAHKINSSTSTVVEEGVTIGDLEIGDWRVTVERIDDDLGQGEQS